MSTAELDDLFHAWLTRELEPDEAEHLIDLLGDALMRRRWRALADLEGALAERGAAVAAEPPSASAISTRRLLRRPTRRQAPRRLLVAAAILLSALGLGLLWSLPHGDPGLPLGADGALARGAAVAGPQTLRWRDGSRVVLGDGTAVRVLASGTGLALDHGTLAVSVVPQGAAGFQLRTPEAVVTVLGTRFDLHRDRWGTTLAMHAGRAAFHPHGGERRVVAAGMTARAPSVDAARGLDHDPALLAHWRLDAGDGRAVHDRSGHGHRGTLHGPEWTSDGLRFGGGDDYVRIEAIGDLASVQAGSYTLSAWFRPEVLPAPGVEGDRSTLRDDLSVIVGRRGWTCGLHVTSRGGVFMQHFLSGNRAQPAEASAVGLRPGRWYHLAGVVDRATGETRIAVDGRVIDTTPWPAGSAARDYAPDDPWHIGISWPGADICRWGTRGLIRDVRIYGRALSAKELAQLATIGR